MEPPRDWPALWQEWMSGWGERKNPVMPFWAKDWLADDKVSDMSMHAQGCYLNLLAHNWVQGSLSANLQTLSGVLGVHFRNFKRETWDCKLASHFVPVAEGRISNKRLILEGVKLIRERRRRTPEKNGKPALPSPSPSSSPSLDPPFPPQAGGSGAAHELGTRRRTGTTYRAREAAKAEEAERQKRVRELDEQQARRAEAAKKREKTSPEELSKILEKYKEKKRDG